MNTSQINNSSLNNSTSSFNTIDLAKSTLERATLLNCVEKYSASSPNFRASSQQRSAPSMSGSANRPRRIDMIRACNKARFRDSKDRFGIARGQTTKEGLAKQMPEAEIGQIARQHAVVQVGIHAINGHKLLVKRDKRQVVGLPGLFNVDLLAELTGEDPFLGPMRTAIVKKDVQSFNKLGAYMAQFWLKSM